MWRKGDLREVGWGFEIRSVRGGKSCVLESRRFGETVASASAPELARVTTEKSDRGPWTKKHPNLASNSLDKSHTGHYGRRAAVSFTPTRTIGITTIY